LLAHDVLLLLLLLAMIEIGRWCVLVLVRGVRVAAGTAGCAVAAPAAIAASLGRGVGE